jgi:hypothetical protein
MLKCRQLQINCKRKAADDLKEDMRSRLAPSVGNGIELQGLRMLARTIQRKGR